MKRPICHSVRGAPSVKLGVVKTRRTTNSPTRERNTRNLDGLIDRKGPNLDAADVAQRTLMGLRNVGHLGRVLIKTDNEPAILSLKEEMMRRLEVGAIPVESAPQKLENDGKWSEIVLRYAPGAYAGSGTQAERTTFPVNTP